MNEEILHAYLDGELPEPERIRFEQELASDAELAARYDQLCALHASLDLLPSMESTLDARALLRSERRRRAGRILRLAAPLAAAAAALAFVLVPRAAPDSTAEAVFSVEEQVRYVYWETDDETYGSGDLSELEGEILEALEPS